MLKKLVCLVLAVLMILPALVACNDGDAAQAVVDSASQYTTTINMWMETESDLIAKASDLVVRLGLTPKLIKQVEEGKAQLNADQQQAWDTMSAEQKTAWEQYWTVSEAFNQITKAKFKTQVNLKMYTEDTYYSAVTGAFTDHEAALEANNGILPQDKLAAGESGVNEYGIPELKYPSVHSFQVDILYIGSYEQYTEYVRNEWLEGVNAMLEDAALKMNSYMSQAFLTAAFKEGLYYAFPNNHGVGEYVYLLADKELMSEYGDLSNATIYDTDFQTYLDYVYANYSDADNKIYPIYSETGDVEINYTHFWNYDVDSTENIAVLKHNQFSLFGTSFGGQKKLKNDNLLTDKDYMQRLAVKTHYENTEGYLTTDADAKAAVRIVKGGWELKQQYEAEGYQVLVMQYPQMTSDEIFSSMFAIGSHSGDANKSAEIITYINTNEELRNILLYGVEGTNYTFDYVTIDEKQYSYVVPTENNAYWMDVSKTGNEFLAYPNSEESILQWEYDKQQNLQAVVYPTLAMELDLKTYKIDKDCVRTINAVSEKLAVYIEDNLSTYNEVMSLYSVACGKVSDKQMASFLLGLLGTVTYTADGAEVTVTADSLAAALTTMKNQNLSKDKTAPQSPYALYLDWCTKNEIG